MSLKKNKKKTGDVTPDSTIQLQNETMFQTKIEFQTETRFQSEDSKSVKI